MTKLSPWVWCATFLGHSVVHTTEHYGMPGYDKEIRKIWYRHLHPGEWRKVFIHKQVVALRVAKRRHDMRPPKCVSRSDGATPGRARSNALAKKLLPWLAPWLAPWLTEIFTFGPSQSSQLMTCLTTVLNWKWRPGCLDVLAPPLVSRPHSTVPMCR